jgi:oxygen-independent coproporphyrinogen-3 oxidase
MCNFRVDLGSDATRWAPEIEALRPLADEGLCVVVDADDGPQVSVTPLGRPFVRNLAMKFDAYLGRGDRRGSVFSRTI